MTRRYNVTIGRLPPSNAQAVTDPVAVSDTAVLERGYGLAFTDTEAMGDALAFTLDWARPILEAVGVTDSLATVLFSLEEQVIADPVGILDPMERVTSYVRAMTDQLGLTDQVAKVITWDRSRTDAVGVTEDVTIDFSGGDPIDDLRGWQVTTSNVGRTGAGYTGTTVYAGSTSLSSGVHLIEDMRISSPITVSGTAQVTIRGCTINPSGTTNGNFIRCDSGTPTLVVEDCDIDGINVAGGLNGVAYMFAISTKAGTCTIRRNRVRRVGRAFIFSGSPTLNYNHNHVAELVSFGNPAGTGSHNECFQTFEGFSGSMTMVDNWLDGDTANATASVTLQGSASGALRVTMEGNYLNGGGYTLVQDGSWGSGTLLINNNRWGPDRQYGTISIEDTACSSGSGNYLYDSGNPPTYAGSGVSIP